LHASVEIGVGMAQHHRAPAEKKQASSGKTTEEPEGVRIRLLGGFRVSVGNRTIEENAGG
jgi:hypothetical protein